LKIDSLFSLIEVMLDVNSVSRPVAVAVAERLYSCKGSLSILHALCCKGLLPLEEMFESVAELNAENRRAETRISKLKLDLKEHKLRIQELYKSNARHNDDYKRVVKTLNLANRSKSKLQRELDEAKLRIQDLQRSNTRYRDDYEKVVKSLYLANASESRL
jgi:septal ring factor EnvC (AmiA/AmiB activator)